MRPLAALAMVGLLAIAWPARADDEEDKPCEPACAAGATCVKGTCMVPAQPATPAPPPAATPAPGHPPAYPPQPYTYPPAPYGYPSPSYAPPGYTPPGYAPPAPPRQRHGGFQPVLYAGLHSFSGDGTSGTDPGLRIGTILGGRVSESFSANGEITIDVINFDAPDGATASGGMAQMTFSPLFHASTPTAELVIGPKFGAWAMANEASSAGVTATVEEQGWTFGANAGVFFPVGTGTTSLGMLFSFANMQITHACQTISGLGEQCPDVDGDFNLFSVTFAAML